MAVSTPATAAAAEKNRDDDDDDKRAMAGTWRRVELTRDTRSVVGRTRRLNRADAV